MIVIKEADALGYLDRVDQTFHSAIRYTPVPWIHTMIRIQRAYLSTLMDDPETRGMAKILVDSSGFPELPSLVGDVGRAFNAVDDAKKERSKVYLELLENVGKERDIEGDINKLTAVMVGDKRLLEVVKTKDDKERNSINTIRNWIYFPDTLPVFLRDDLGMISTQYRANGQLAWCAMKYIDNLGGRPLLYLSFSQNSTNSHEYGTFYGGDQGMWEFDRLLTPLRGFLLGGDYTLTGVDGFEALYKEMVTFTDAIRRFKEKSNIILNAEDLDSDQNAEELREIHNQLNLLIENASGEDLKMAFRVRLGLDVNSLKDSALRLSGQSTAVTKSERFNPFGFLKRLPRVRIKWKI